MNEQITASGKKNPSSFPALIPGSFTFGATPDDADPVRRRRDRAGGVRPVAVRVSIFEFFRRLSRNDELEAVAITTPI
jgi:hypothetical protein